MSTITVEIPEQIKEKFWIGENITYDTLISKTMGAEFCPPDFKFTEYNKIKESHKVEYNKVEKIDKDKLLNI